MREMRNGHGPVRSLQDVQPDAAEISPPEAVVRTKPAKIRVVPDLDDDFDDFEDSVREHLERLTAAADSDIASMSREESMRP